MCTCVCFPVCNALTVPGFEEIKERPILLSVVHNDKVTEQTVAEVHRRREGLDVETLVVEVAALPNLLEWELTV